MLGVIVEYIRYRVPEPGAAAFEDAYRRAVVPLSAAPQCVDYELTRCADEPGCYALRIRWTSANDHTAGFRRSAAFGAFFAEIEPYVGNIEEMRHYEPLGIDGCGSSVPTLYEWAGGAAALEKLFTTFYERMRLDPELAPVFAEMSPEHAKHVATWLGEVFGGPARYSEQRGGHAHMLGKHVGKAITETQRRRWVDLLLDTADEIGLPDDPEFRSAFVAYLELGSRMARLLSQPDARPDFDEPMPRWGWGEVRPWQPAS
ncbi:antibiotic biosynthesis monooxygenase [Saccharopolyspora sp. K220]|uniref:group II truncated hemoglobin n=1 Tax=Saccharopolyspora soli TaxID=2926618 RepID=UPI001F56CBA4|nr:antibiotic biosynthesis monooxygenase [Saccharopolyspora soli]MCI2421949.1 antibiotic biosynthesis monooxygenase [Saccharopolyspora soli]